MAAPDDTRPPPPDLDVPAARAAARLHAAAVARGVEETVAWAEAVNLFRLHHPAWPLPLAEREAARTVGALIAWARGAPAVQPFGVPPGPLLRRLAEPESPSSGQTPATRTPFRAGWSLRHPVRVAPPSLPLRFLPGPSLSQASR